MPAIGTEDARMGIWEDAVLVTRYWILDVNNSGERRKGGGGKRGEVKKRREGKPDIW